MIFKHCVFYLESNYPQCYFCLCSGRTKSLSPIDFPIRLVNGVSFRFWIPSALLLLRNSRYWPPIALWDHFRIRCWHGRSVLCYPTFTYYWRINSNKGKRILIRNSRYFTFMIFLGFQKYSKIGWISYFSMNNMRPFFKRIQTIFYASVFSSSSINTQVL